MRNKDQKPQAAPQAAVKMVKATTPDSRTRRLSARSDSGPARSAKSA